MNAFHTYRGGNPPTPGMFATDASVYGNGQEARIGDIIVNKAAGKERGIVIGIYGNSLVYLIEEADPRDETGTVGDFFYCGFDDAKPIGHAYDTLREIARIEAAAEKGSQP